MSKFVKLKIWESFDSSGAGVLFELSISLKIERIAHAHLMPFIFKLTFIICGK